MAPWTDRCVAMEHDIFFSISQTPDEHGHIPNEATMLRNYFQQLACADELGFGVGWIAQAHLSTETQKSNTKPVVPHWKGEFTGGIHWGDKNMGKGRKTT